MTRTRRPPNTSDRVEESTDVSDAEPRAAALIQARVELEALGLIRWNGEYRRGQKVYVAVPPEEMTASALAAYRRIKGDGEAAEG